MSVNNGTTGHENDNTEDGKNTNDNHKNNIVSHTVTVESGKKNDEKKIFNFMKASTIDCLTVLLAEFIGTALLVFLGCMGCINGLTAEKVTHFQSSISFGFVIMILVNVFGCVSGAHFNPSVTVAAYVYNLVSLKLAGLYMVAQFLGGFLGFGLLKLLTPLDFTTTDPGMCTTALNKAVSPAQGLFIEFMATAVLILLCGAVWDPRNSKHHDSVAIRFGLAIACLALIAGPYTGASMNPARSLAPAIWNNNYDHHWIYWVGPLSAGFIVSFIFKYVFRREAPVEKQQPFEEFPLARDNKSSA